MAKRYAFILLSVLVLGIGQISGLCEEATPANLIVTDRGNGYLSRHWFRDVLVYPYDPETKLRASEPIAVFSPAEDPIEVSASPGHYVVVAHVRYDPADIVLGYIDVVEGQSTVLEISAVTVPIEPQEY
jgi:hypothetical protein